MIHYHGLPIGGCAEDVRPFFENRHVLISYGTVRQSSTQPLDAIERCASFVLDNGAFTVWKRGEGRVDYDGFVEWVTAHALHPQFRWALIPDVIDGSVEENDALVNRWPDHLPGVPIWHVHEPIRRLQRLCDTHDTVALGSSGEYSTPGTGAWWKRMTTVMNTICDSNGTPPCNLHGLRMLDPAVFTHLPLASADSTNAGRNNNQSNRFGMYVPPSPAMRAATIAARIEEHDSADAWNPEAVRSKVETVDDATACRVRQRHFFEPA